MPAKILRDAKARARFRSIQVKEAQLLQPIQGRFVGQRLIRAARQSAARLLQRITQMIAPNDFERMKAMISVEMRRNGSCSGRAANDWP